MVNFQRFLNALIIWILASIMLAAFGVQLFLKEQPCPLCLLQRIGMLGVAFGAMLNLQFRIRPIHYALMLFSALYGGFVALRQIMLHVCPGFPQFGMPILGLSLYTWSFLVFVCVIAAVAFLLCLYETRQNEETPTPLHWFFQGADWFILAIAVMNIFSTLLLCGISACKD